MSRTSIMFNSFMLAPLGLLMFSASALGQSNVANSGKFSYAENIGWMNWRDSGSPAGTEGVQFGSTFVSGFIWSGNIGYINLGDGSPANGVSYANPTSGFIAGTPDFGVNLNPLTGMLSGFAWGENVGWINFGGGAMATPAQPARLDSDGQRLRGFAWGENIGWINLDLAETGKFVQVRTCSADFNGDGEVNPDDLADYIGCYFSQPPCAASDFNEDGGIDPDDLADFIGAYFAGCGN